jgi:predicted ribosome quality control (RQC) complex YloA/Tae2 family protein
MHGQINKLSTQPLSFFVKNGIFQYIVDNTMLTTYYTLRYLSSKLNSTLAGQNILSIHTQTKDELVVALASPETHLVISCKSDGPTCYLHSSFARARRNSVDLFPSCVGQAIAQVSVVPGDRIIHCSLSDGRILALHFFGPKPNVLLVGLNRTVDDAFQSARTLVGTQYNAKPREDVYDCTQLDRTLGPGAAGSALTAVRSAFPLLGSTLIRELLERTGTDPSIPAASADPRLHEELCATLQSMLKELDHPSPRLYSEPDGTPVIFSLIPLRQAAGLQERIYDDIHEAIRHYSSRRRRAQQLAGRKTEFVALIRREADRARRTLDALDAATIDGARADEYELCGTLLLSAAGGISKGSRTADLDSPSGSMRISLDPALSPIQNAQRYFTKARRARAAAEQARERSAQLRNRVLTAETLLSLLDATESDAELNDLLASHAPQFAQFSIHVSKGAVRELPPFRTFRVDGGFEVWAGKSSANNDQLTFKHARPNDLWFHARGASGSHVVLRVATGHGTPGKRAKEEAAAIAAYYSRMRTAGLVPVAMTERKFVHKPKGAPPGTVSLQRETVLIVRPALPAGTTPD